MVEKCPWCVQVSAQPCWLGQMHLLLTLSLVIVQGHDHRLHICCIAKGQKQGQQPHTLFVWPHFTSNHITIKGHHGPFKCCLCLLGCCLLLPQGPRSVL